VSSSRADFSRHIEGARTDFIETFVKTMVKDVHCGADRFGRQLGRLASVCEKFLHCCHCRTHKEKTETHGVLFGGWEILCAANSGEGQLRDLAAKATAAREGWFKQIKPATVMITLPKHIRTRRPHIRQEAGPRG
jgi:hypothetical protein